MMMIIVHDMYTRSGVICTFHTRVRLSEEITYWPTRHWCID